jgi:hypothetical protein
MEEEKEEKGEWRREKGRRVSRKRGMGRGVGQAGPGGVNVRPAGIMGRGTPGFSGRGEPTRPSRERLVSSVTETTLKGFSLGKHHS